MERTVRLEIYSTGWVDLLGRFWCKHFHTSVMWPIHGVYECGECGRHYSVPWDVRNPMQARPSLRLVIKRWPGNPLRKAAISHTPCTTGPRRFRSLSAETGEDAA
jgi:hypothetical protein